MSPINKTGRPVEGYERKTYKIYARIEPFEQQELKRALRLTGDTMAEAVRKGLHLYLSEVRKEMRERGR